MNENDENENAVQNVIMIIPKYICFKVHMFLHMFEVLMFFIFIFLYVLKIKKGRAKDIFFYSLKS